MFWFQHPRPPSRKEVAEQIVMRKQAVPDVKVLIVESDGGAKLPVSLPPGPQGLAKN